ncbi:MAG TPA: hypothetical protein DD670_19340 [Planctomycetaceae bacterium]|nr:hypothetical protein [Planctomycetaceae bacterium]
MQANVELPKAFSVRDEHEFYPIQHLMARLNPKLMVTQIATGMHVSGGETVFWGLVFLEGDSPDQTQVESALQAAGFDMARSRLTQAAFMWSDRSVVDDREKMEDGGQPCCVNSAKPKPKRPTVG